MIFQNLKKYICKKNWAEFWVWTNVS